MSQSGSERRQWPRIPAAALKHISASVVAGPAVRLVNLSRGGALMEVASSFPMRSRVRLKLTQSTGEVTVAEGLVAWARVAAIVDKQLNYLVAVIFDKPIPDLGGLDTWPEPDETRPAITAPPVAGAAAVPRDNLPQVTTSVRRGPETPAGSDRWIDEGEQIVPLDVNDVDSRHGSAGSPIATHGSAGKTNEEGAALAAANETLTAQLAAAEAERLTLRKSLDIERRAREEERAKLIELIANAAASVAALQTTLAAREQDCAQALAALERQRSRAAAAQSDEFAHREAHAR